MEWGWRIGRISGVFGTTDIYVSDNERSAGQKTALAGLGAKRGGLADLSAKNCRFARDGVPTSRPPRSSVLPESRCGRLEWMRGSLVLMTLALLLLAIPAWSQSYVGAQEWGRSAPKS